jgi:hypothetical protein
VSTYDRPDETNERIVAVLALLITCGAMAIDHLVGTEGGEDDSFPVDPAMFAIALVLSVAAAGLLFGWLVPRQRRRGPERAARTGLVCSVLSIVPGVAFVWIGFPFVIAGAGLALGLEGRRGTRRLEATVAVVVAALVLGLGALAYLIAAIR